MAQIESITETTVPCGRLSWLLVCFCFCFLFIQQLQIIGVDVSVCQIFVLGVSLLTRQCVWVVAGMQASCSASLTQWRRYPECWPRLSLASSHRTSAVSLLGFHFYRASQHAIAIVFLSFWLCPSVCHTGDLRLNDSYVVRRTIQLMFLTFQGQTSQSKVLGFTLKGRAK